MAQALIVSGQNFIGAGLGRALRLTSDRASLVGEFILGRDAATSAYNSAYDGAPNATAIGSLTYGDHFANPAGANYFRTMILGAENMTMMAVVAPGADANSEIYLASSSNAVNSWYLAGFSSNQPALSVINAASSAQQLLANAAQSTPYTDFRAIAGRVGGLSAWSMELDEFKGGTLVQNKSSTATGSRSVDSQVFCIGSIGGASTFNAAKNISAVLFWHRLLSDAELLAAYLEARNTLGRMGIAC
jgi:hypothetical protein